MHINQRKEQFSVAYVRAVASAAGFAVYTPSVDDDSVDIGIAASGDVGTVRSPKLDMQLKCTSREIVGAASVAFPLKLKNYDDLRDENVMVPRILVVMIVPDALGDWLAHTEEELLVRHCAYWLSLRGLGASNNEGNVTVHLPRINVFTVETIGQIMARLQEGGQP